ncbi:hypothetical protein CLOP_g14975 [Closterium sp. NIES-67]|nr:hypothetical protein CLOP_g14975 [Closterium sp. NIES-67]
MSGNAKPEQNEATGINKLCASVLDDLAKIIREYPEIFPDDVPSGLPTERPQGHKIELERGAQPSVRTQWRLTQPKLHELRNLFDNLLAKGFIRPSTSPFAAPILFTPKKDGRLRMCTDYRAFNQVTLKSRFPIPRTDELIDNLRGARYFSKIDLRGGCHQIWVFADDCHKIVFRTRYGSYEYTVMPFRLTNAPSTFQLTMNGVFRDLLDKCVIIYLDDILIYSKTREQHLKDLEAIFQWLQHHRLQVRAFKKRNGVPRALLRITDPERPFEVITDASDISIRAVLMQNFSNGLQPITYESRKMQSAERNYPVHDKEMLAIVHALKIWRCYLTGVDVALRSGTDRIWVPSYCLLRELLIQEVHDSNLSGHFGVDKTLKALQQFYCWPNMVTCVQRYVAACPICQRIKSSHQRSTGLLQPLEPPQRPWQHVTMDFVTGLPAGSSGNDAVLVVVDRLTKMAHFAP